MFLCNYKDGMEVVIYDLRLEQRRTHRLLCIVLTLLSKGTL